MQRVVALDIIKAIAICLLVLGHVIEGLLHMAVIDAGSYLVELQAWLRTFRMPAFFFAAGAVIGLQPLRAAGYFLHHRVATLAYPHLLWGLIYLFVAVLFARYYNSPIQEPGNVGRHVFEIVIGQKSWFLVALFLVSSLGYFLFRIDGRLALLVALLLCLLPVDSRWTALSRSFDFAVFFAIGYLAIGTVLRLTTRLTAASAGIATIALFILSAVLQRILPPFSDPVWGGLSLLLLGSTGTAGLWCLSTLIATQPKLKVVLAALGTASLAIFVMHPMAIGAARVALVPLLRDAPAIVPTLLIAGIGIALPALAYYILKKLGLVSPLLILPLPQARRAPAAAE